MKFFWVSIIGIVISFAGGFLIANAINRSEITTLTAENGRLKKNLSESVIRDAPPKLSDEQIRKNLAEAEKNKDNFSLQKNLSLALYRYSKLTKDKKLLVDVKKLLLRANKLNPDDFDVLVSLGNIHFDIGRIEKKPESIENARGYYRKALAKNSQNIDVRTDLGWTYLAAAPAETQKAIEEFRKSLEINAKHEKSLQLIIEAFLKQGNNSEARNYLAKLKTVNPKNGALSKLEKQLETKNNE